MMSFIRFTCPYLVTKFNLTNVKVFIFDKDRDMLKTGVKFATFPLLSYLRNIPKIVLKLMCKMGRAGFLM